VVPSGWATNANQQHEGAGIAVTNLRVAVTQRTQQDGEWRDGETSFFKVNVRHEA
jgi:single-stranded DNA-binding protein